MVETRDGTPGNKEVPSCVTHVFCRCCFNFICGYQFVKSMSWNNLHLVTCYAADIASLETLLKLIASYTCFGLE